MITPRILKGFRDFLPNESRRRQYLLSVMQKSFSSFGFEPLETPSMEYEEILTGKYGEEAEGLMYRFVDNGKRNVALRYDQTVPLARVLAQYKNILAMPFKRYQVQPVWRAENTQKGRFREFIQADIDIAGTSSALADSEVIEVAAKTLTALGFSDFTILINDRSAFTSLITKGILTPNELTITAIAVDKIKKIGRDGVLSEMNEKGIDPARSEKILGIIEKQEKTKTISDIHTFLGSDATLAKKCTFDPTLVRGLSYYTGMIFEIEVQGYTAGSVCGGGRYDNLVGIFASEQIPAVGCSFGFDRILEAMELLNLFPAELADSSSKVLVSIFNNELASISLDTAVFLRGNGINSEIYLGEVKPKNPLEKQLKYADQKKIPFVIIIGPEEAETKTATIRNMKTREQKTIAVSLLPKELA